MKNKVRVIILLAIFGLFMTATQSCDKQEDQSTEQVTKKSGDEMTWPEYIESLDIVEEYDSPNSYIEGLTSSGSYVIVSVGSYSDTLTSPNALPEGHNGPHLCCSRVFWWGGEMVHECCWAYECVYCDCNGGDHGPGPIDPNE